MRIIINSQEIMQYLCKGTINIFFFLFLKENSLSTKYKEVIP